MRYTQEQLQNFFGENVDVTTLPAAITGSNTAEISLLTIFLIMLLVIFIINIAKLFVKKIVESKDIDNFSSSKELVTYSSAQNEDKKSNQKQNIYNKYYFNVYVKQPYNKNGKQNNYNNKANYTYQKKDTDDVIDAEIVL